MTTYCYRCPDCGTALTGTDRDLNDGAIHCEQPIKRDYRAEAVGVGQGVVVSRSKERIDTHAFREWSESALG